MFNQLSEKLVQSIQRIRSGGKFTEENIQSALSDIKAALLEADVALPVVKQVIEDIQQKAIGQTITQSVRAGDAFIKLFHDELVHILGDEIQTLQFKGSTPHVILMAGLQGSGKTTTVGKLANFLKNEQKKSVMVVSCDVYRPAAIEQLAILAKQIGVAFYPSEAHENPVKLCKQALAQAQKQFVEVLIVDTAGRLHIDDAMMEEIRAIHQTLQPTETLLTVDSMVGQDAAHIAKTFNDQLALTGVVLTKVDGDSRGGAALSMRLITGKPIKFIGMGEKIDALESFYPERMASRILGMGDIVGLVEEAQRKVDEKEAQKMAKKFQKGARFDFNDFLSQLQQMKRMGGIQSLLGKLPTMPQIPQGKAALFDDNAMKRMEAIIQSMTRKERLYPTLLNGSRKRRVAEGSGSTLQDVNKLLKQFENMQKMLKRVKGDKFAKRLKQMQDQLPPDLLKQFPPDLLK